MATRLRLNDLTVAEAEVLAEALDVFCFRIREDWDGRPPAHVQQANGIAWRYRTALMSALEKEGHRG
ncbi:unannotated protein [freshwater metagenome]|uniref:Unannotated protein n=1 Tax=freshwater metagenome TaxID=449393 RepID=A0A6J7H5U1_9ZZZZ|nr:hypothetical protein [Actinomycetota bacterium]